MPHDSIKTPRGRQWHKNAFRVIFLLVLLITVTSFLPAIDSDRWWIRVLDFPRLQQVIALLILTIPVILYFRYFQLLAGSALIMIIATLSYHFITLYPYLPTKSDFDVADCPAGNELSIMVANVKMRSDPDGSLLKLVRTVQPDILLAMETHETWNEALAPLEKMMPHTIAHISDSTYGIHLFSKLLLDSPAIRFLAGQDTPQIVTGVTLRNGETVDFLGIHPRPPKPTHDTTTSGRDAVLYEAAFLLRDSERTGIVAGDFNATPWERTVEQMREIGQLEDPRRHYGYVATFSARSWWMSWPLDQIFHEAGFVTISLERLSNIGSDHYPFVARLCYMGDSSNDPLPPADPELIRQAKQAIKAARQGA